MARVDVTAEGAPPDDAFGGDPSGLVERAARAALADRGVADAELSLALVEDVTITALNRQWKRRNGPTDVLAFALQDEGEPPLGDVYIGWRQALRQAEEEGENPARELARLAIHGTLHVLGWDHPEEDRERSEMWQHQERILEGVEIR